MTFIEVIATENSKLIGRGIHSGSSLVPGEENKFLARHKRPNRRSDHQCTTQLSELNVRRFGRLCSMQASFKIVYLTW